MPLGVSVGGKGKGKGKWAGGKTVVEAAVNVDGGGVDELGIALRPAQ